jgi:hypothetical protein
MAVWLARYNSQSSMPTPLTNRESLFTFWKLLALAMCGAACALTCGGCGAGAPPPANPTADSQSPGADDPAATPPADTPADSPTGSSPAPPDGTPADPPATPPAPPPPPTAGSIFGNLDLQAPDFIVRATAPTDAGRQMPLYLLNPFGTARKGDPGTAGVLTFPHGDDGRPFLRTVPAIASGRFRLSYSFENLAPGDYQLGFFEEQSRYLSIVLIPPSETVFEFLNPVDVRVAGAPQRADYSFALAGSGGNSSAAGRLLLSGNSLDGVVELRLGTALPAGSSELAVKYGLPRWLEYAGTSLYGRYFFSLEGLTAGHYSTQWNSYPAQSGTNLWQEAETDRSEPLSLDFDVAAQQALLGLRAYGYRMDFEPQAYDVASGVADRYEGWIELELLLDPSRLDWSRDLLVLAENEGSGINTVNQRSWNYLAPEHFRNGVAHYGLRMLREGNYRLSLLQLGATNADPITVLSRRDRLVQMQYPDPTPYADFSWNKGAPYEAVTWAPRL